MLGEPPGSAKLEHMRLDVEGVAAVVRQRTAEAVEAAVAEAEERLRAGQVMVAGGEGRAGAAAVGLGIGVRLCLGHT